MENLKQAFKTLAQFGMALEDSLEDNKITFFESVTLITKLIGLAPVVTNWDQIKEAYENLDDDGYEELYDDMVENLDLEDDDIEVIVEKAFKLGLALDDFIKTL